MRLFERFDVLERLVKGVGQFLVRRTRLLLGLAIIGRRDLRGAECESGPQFDPPRIGVALEIIRKAVLVIFPPRRHFGRRGHLGELALGVVDEGARGLGGLRSFTLVDVIAALTRRVFIMGSVGC